MVEADPKFQIVTNMYYINAGKVFVFHEVLLIDFWFLKAVLLLFMENLNAQFIGF